MNNTEIDKNISEQNNKTVGVPKKNGSDDGMYKNQENKIKYGQEYFEFSKNHRGFDMRCCGKWQEEFADMLIDTFGLKETMILFDVGTAMGANLEALYRKNIKGFGADVSQWYIDNCPFPLIKPNLGVIINNKMPFKSDMFDFVLMSQVIEHIPEVDIVANLHDIKRTMRKGAIFYISTVNPPKPNEDIGDPTHISCFEKSKWHEIFLECGFEICTDEYEPRLLAHKLAADNQWLNFILRK